jgi:S-adenosylmethionine:tRNA ribosyltransferase-isomerase
MDIEDFDYDLPRELIAQEPLPRREGSRMMVVRRGSGEIRHDMFRSLPGFFSRGDLLVVNDSKVIPARLLGHDGLGRPVEVLLVREVKPRAWTALVRPSRRVDTGSVVVVSPGDCEVRVIERLEGSRRLVEIDTEGPLGETLERLGHVPLPPYIRRPDRAVDRDRYQTVFASHKGSVAAPTAGLHFDVGVLGDLASKGVGTACVTLHVGPGTFRPVRVKDPRGHRMEEEYFRVGAGAAALVKGAREVGGNVVAVGTTTVRALESASDGSGEIGAAEGLTGLFIYPPYRFRAVDRLLTNFHLPRSTLLMLVSAFAGRDLILEAYRKAIREGYRFYSYGDVMLIL